MIYIVGHVSPDLDCIAALWLLQRFGGFEEATITLVNTGAPDAEILRCATAVVDTGRVHDPLHHRYDHHQMPGRFANETCATSLVFEWLVCSQGELFYLQPLIDLVYAGDTGKPEAKQSYVVGIHALLSAFKARGKPDEELIIIGYELFDVLAEGLKRADEARETLAAHTVYRSADGLFVALDQSSRAAVQAAHESGARLVLWHRTFETTETIELWRGGEGPDVNCGALVTLAINAPSITWRKPELRRELASWYRHEAGFYAGRGSSKAPDMRPLTVPVAELAAALDAVWGRT